MSSDVLHTRLHAMEAAHRESCGQLACFLMAFDALRSVLVLLDEREAEDRGLVRIIDVRSAIAGALDLVEL